VSKPLDLGVDVWRFAVPQPIEQSVDRAAQLLLERRRDPRAAKARTSES